MEREDVLTSELGTPKAPFGDVPVFTPPRGARRTKQARGLAAVLLLARDILSTFSANAYQRRISHWRLLGRDLIVPNEPDLVREALVDRHDALQRKTPQMRRGLQPLLGDGLFVSDGETWKTRRAAVAPIIHGRHQARFFPVMLETSLEWRDHWEAKKVGEPIDVLAEMGCLTAEIISRTIFGRQLGRPQTGRIIKGFARYQRHVDQLALADMLRLPAFVPRWQNPLAHLAIREIHAVIDGIIDEYLAGKADATTAPGGEEPLIASLFRARDREGRPFDRAAVRNEAITIFMAGHETTANTLAWAFYLLSQADWARQRLHRELESQLSDSTPSAAEVQRLVYTRAVIEETLRLYPPVPILGREAVEPTRIADTDVAEGSLVLVAPWLLHRNAKLWPRPDDFVPERFLPGKPRPSKHQYVPFAVGPRICPGMAFGLLEATLCLAVLAQRFDLVLEANTDVRPLSRLTLRPGHRLPMRLYRRAGVAVRPGADPLAS